MVVRRNEWKARIFDGKLCDKIVQEAEKVCRRLVRMCQPDSLQTNRIDVQHAPFPEQLDEWSCGHRLILAVQTLLRSGVALENAGGWMVSIDDFTISEEAVSSGAIGDLCKGLHLPAPNTAFAPGQSVKVQPVKVESVKRDRGEDAAKPDGDPKPPSTPTRRNRATDFSDSVRTPDNPEKAKKAKKQKKEPAGQTAPPAQCSSSASAAPRAERQSGEAAAPTAERDDDDDDDADLTFDQALDKAVGKLLAERAATEASAREKRIAKKILNAAGMDFNRDYQKRHCCKLPNGHWDLFLKGVNLLLAKDGDGKSVDCEVCRKIMVDFNIGAYVAKYAEGLQPRGKPTDPGLATDPQPAAPEPAAEGDVSTAEPVAKRRKGRPAKGTSVDFNVMHFIAKHRAGQYRPLSEEEAGLSLLFLRELHYL